MKFTATEKEVRKICINAIKASKPVGLGFLHYSDEVKTKEDDILISMKTFFDLDYIEGRMVKLGIRKIGENLWETMGGDKPNVEYQSWCSTYPTYESLVESLVTKK